MLQLFSRNEPCHPLGQDRKISWFRDNLQWTTVSEQDSFKGAPFQGQKTGETMASWFVRPLRTISSLVFLLLFTRVSLAGDVYRLREQYPPGYQYHVSTRVDLMGALTLPPEKGGATGKRLSLTGNSAIEYDEKVLAEGTDGAVQKTVRIYRRMDFQRLVAGQLQQNSIRPAVRRLVLLRHKQMEVPFSPDGPLTWEEMDMVRTDVFTPALSGLLPAESVRAGDRWNAARGAIQELTDMERIDEGAVECRLEQITILENRRHARVAFSGVVRGLNEDGHNRQKLDGYFYFDLESNHLSYLSLKGVSFMLDANGKEQGQVEGQFVLTRQAHTRSSDLTEEVLRPVVLEPNAENTRLLYDNPDLGIRLLHPRRWHMAGVRGRQLAFDEKEGSGLLLTLEPRAQVPTAAQFLAESREYLEKQKVRILNVDPPQQIQPAPQELDHFVLHVEIEGKRVVMDYYVLRQAQGGATLVARLLPAGLAQLQKEVAEMAKSATIQGRK